MSFVTFLYSYPPVSLCPSSILGHTVSYFILISLPSNLLATYRLKTLDIFFLSERQTIAQQRVDRHHLPTAHFLCPSTPTKGRQHVSLSGPSSLHRKKRVVALTARQARELLLSGWLENITGSATKMTERENR